MPRYPKTHKEDILPHTDYSIIIPAYNESARIGSTLERILHFIQQQQWNAEVIVVNDGSHDETQAIVHKYMEKNANLRLLENPGNRGKGYAVRNGMLHASGEILLFTDADLSSPIEEASKLFEAIGHGADIAIGSRWLRPDTQVRKQPLYRQLGSRGFNLALRIILRLPLKDTQCGFKAFTRSAAQLVFSPQRIERWGFDAEILYLGRKFGLKIEEVPVLWAHSSGTRLHPWRDGIHMLADVIKVRRYSLAGGYKEAIRAQSGSNSSR